MVKSDLKNLFMFILVSNQNLDKLFVQLSLSLRSLFTLIFKMNLQVLSKNALPLNGNDSQKPQMKGLRSVH